MELRDIQKRAQQYLSGAATGYVRELR